MKKTWIKILFALFLFVGTLEVAMRVMGIQDTYMERAVGSFRSEYGIVSNRPYHTWNPGWPVEYKQSEFSYSYMANPDGFREAPFPTKPSDSVDVVYILGDSFVEGDGAPYDSTMPRFVEQRFHREGYKRVKVYNVGVCGNDPIFSYRFFEDKLLATRPRLVLFFTGPSDLYDLHIRGGFERFTADGYRYKPKPWGLDLYRYSRISRLFFAWAGYGEGLVPKMTSADSAAYLAQVAYSLYKSDSLCRQYNIPVLMVGYPHPGDHRFPSFGEYTRWMNSYLADHYRGVPYMDIAPDLKDSLVTYTDQLYWPVNLHFNSRGYGFMARVVYEKMAATHPEAFRQLRKDTAEVHLP